MLAIPMVNMSNKWTERGPPRTFAELRANLLNSYEASCLVAAQISQKQALPNRPEVETPL